MPPKIGKGSKLYVNPHDLYVVSDLSLDELCEHLKGQKGASRGWLRQRCSEEGWEADRAAWRERNSQRVREAASLAAVEQGVDLVGDARSIQKMGRLLLEAGKKAIERLGGPDSILKKRARPSEILEVLREGGRLLDGGARLENELTGGLSGSGPPPTIVFVWKPFDGEKEPPPLPLAVNAEILPDEPAGNGHAENGHKENGNS